MENGVLSLRGKYLESYEAFVDALPAAVQQQISAIRDVHAEAYRLIQQAENGASESTAQSSETGQLSASENGQHENVYGIMRGLDELLEKRSVFVSKLLELVRSTVSRVDANYQLLTQQRSSESEHLVAPGVRNGRAGVSASQTAVRRRFLEGSRKREHVAAVSSTRRVASKRAALRKNVALPLSASVRRGNGVERVVGVRAGRKRAELSKEDEEQDAEEDQDAESEPETERRTVRERKLSNALRRVARRSANGRRRRRSAAVEEPGDDADEPDEPAKDEPEPSSSAQEDDAEPEEEPPKRTRRSPLSDDPEPARDDAAQSSSDEEDASPPRRADLQANRRTRNSHVESRTAATGSKRAVRGPGKAKRAAANASAGAANAAGAQAFNPADFVIEPEEPTYCLCHQVSYGEMVCCDNPACNVEWFHFACVNLKTKPKGKWYCPQCRSEPTRSNVMRKRTDKRA